MRPHLTQLRSLQKQDLIDCLSANNIIFTDEVGNAIDPATSIGWMATHDYQAHWFDLNTLVDQDATYDEDGNELTPTTYFPGYHADVVSTSPLTITQGVEVVTPKNPKHHIAR